MESTNSHANEWPTTQISSSQQQHSSVDHHRGDITDSQEQRMTPTDKASRHRSTISALLQGMLLGVLTGGLVLAVIISLWMTSATAKKGAESSLMTSRTNTTTNVSSSTTIGQSTSMITNASTSPSTSPSTSTTTMTTQNPQLDSLTVTSIPEGQWTSCTYSYMAAISGTLTLQVDFQASPKHDWYIDDVSVKDPTAVEMLTNGNFESGSSPTGWTTSIGSCGSSTKISTAQSNSPKQSYYTTCSSITSISQSFIATSGQTYSVSLWIYLERTSPGSFSNPSLTVTMS